MVHHDVVACLRTRGGECCTEMKRKINGLRVGAGRSRAEADIIARMTRDIRIDVYINHGKRIGCFDRRTWLG